jgi:NAD(P)-dependent dehydrogenase (short-subunit alcohol dehydrogenase family)
MQTVTDRVAIVTGGGQGIGGATARRLAQGGARVLIADFDVAAAQENVARIEQNGGTAAWLQTDVSQPAAIEAMVTRAVDQWGRLDILVNNAWRGQERDGSAVTLTETAWDYAFNVMVKSHYLAAKYAVPHMARAAESFGTSSSIVNISSVHGLMMAERALAYEGAKSAVIGITRQMACDFGPLGIRVNAICPGHIMTERMKQHWEKNPSFFPFFEQQYPVRRVGKPEDIANAVHFLSTEEASFITGHTLVVDGGLTIQLQENLSIRLTQFYRDHPEMQLPG